MEQKKRLHEINSDMRRAMVNNIASQLIDINKCREIPAGAVAVVASATDAYGKAAAIVAASADFDINAVDRLTRQASEKIREFWSIYICWEEF